MLRITALGSLLASLALAFALNACGGDDDDGDHNFATYIECFDHHQEEGLTEAASMEECDAIMEVPDHADEAGCLTDDEVDVTDGVPQSAVNAHCATI